MCWQFPPRCASGAEIGWHSAPTEQTAADRKTDQAPLRSAQIEDQVRRADEYRLAALWGNPPASKEQTQPHPAVVRVITIDRDSMSLGSGTLVDANDQYGLVITNWHVVRDAVGAIEVVFPDGFHSLGQVVRTDKDWDLAALLIWKPPVQPVPLSAVAPKPGELLTIAGYGSGSYLAQSGRCTKYVAPAPGKPQEIVELSAAARHGDSGGPIFNSRGELAGVLFGEGGGSTDGSYSGRVHQFLQLASADLRALPTNRASANNIVAAGQTGASQLAVSSEGGAGTPAYAGAAPPYATGAPVQIAQRTQDFDQSQPAHIDRPLAVSAPLIVGTPSDRSAARTSGAWTGWPNELKSLLAAFGAAAIILQLLHMASRK